MAFPHICILFAAGFDWLESLLPFLFVGFWILSQVYSVFRRVAGGGDARNGNDAGRRLPPGRQRDAMLPELSGEVPRPPAAPAADPAARDELQKQIEDFLRQTTNTGSGPRPIPKPRPAVQSKPTVPKRGTATPTRDTTLRPGTERYAGGLDARNTEVSRHVQDAFAHDLKHERPSIESAASALRAARPTPSTQTAAAAQASLPTAAGAKQLTAAELLQTLRNPATIRQTILLREVLERPVERW